MQGFKSDAVYYIIDKGDTNRKMLRTTDLRLNHSNCSLFVESRFCFFFPVYLQIICVGIINFITVFCKQLTYNIILRSKEYLVSVITYVILPFVKSK